MATFTGLSNNNVYSLVAFGERGNAPYLARYARFTLGGAARFVNSSSAGTGIATKYVANDSTYYSVGDNYSAGYVAKWTDIVPTAGSLTITMKGVDASNTDAVSSAYFNALQLIQTSSGQLFTSAADQIYAYDDPSTTISDLTITDATPATITSANGIRIKIPADLNAVWDQTVTTVSASGAAVSSGKVVATPVVEYDNSKTAYIHTAGNFANAESVTISGLKLQTFSNASVNSHLGLITGGVGQSIVAFDPQNKTITVPTTVISKTAGPITNFNSDTADQYFGTFNISGVGTISSLAVTDYGSESATAANDIGIVKLIEDNGDGIYNSADDTTVLATTTFSGVKATFTSLSINAGSDEYVHVLLDVTSKIVPLPVPTIGIEVLQSTDVITSAMAVSASAWPVTLGTSTLSNIFPFLQDVTTNNIEISWNSGTSAQGSVSYGATNSYGETIQETLTPIVAVSGSSWIHKILISGLATSTTYHYKVTDGSGLTSSDSTFLTAPDSGSDFNFLILGDIAYNADSPNSAYYAIAGNEADIISASNPQTIAFFLGDHQNDGANTSWQPEYFLPERNLLKNTVIYQVLGNHDSPATTMFGNYFDSPVSNNAGGNSTETYYSFNYGNVHFVVLNGNISRAVNSTQYNWLAGDMATDAAQNADYRIIFTHQPGVSYGNHGSVDDNGFIAAITALDSVPGITKNADLIVMGHNHVYERDYKPQGTRGGITWLTAGTTGGNTAAPASSGQYLQYTAPQGYGFTVMSKNSRSLTGTYYYTDNAGLAGVTPTVRDVFTLPILPTISSEAGQTFIVNNATSTISPITITDSNNVSTITAGNDIRIKIPDNFNMTWDTTDIIATITGTSSSEVSTAVTYEDSGKTLVLDVTSDFSTSSSIIVSDLSFVGFAATSGPSYLTMIMGGVTVATDIMPIQIGASVPWAPTSVLASSGDTQTSVSFVTPTFDGGSPITNYVVTSNPGNITGSGTSSPIIVSGLTNGVSYTFSAQAINSIGISSSSASSNSVIPMTVPGAPSISGVDAGNTEATISFTPSISDGGSAIIYYNAKSSPGNLIAYGSSSPLTVTGLTNDITYTFTVTATNAAGTSTLSSVSNAVIPRSSYHHPSSRRHTVNPSVTLVNTSLNIISTTTSSITISTSTVKFIFKNNLLLGMKSSDVIQLQKFLNSNGFIIANTGVGSPGKETNYFGILTKNMLIKYQEANAKDILEPVGLKKGTGYFGASTRNFVNSR